MSPGDWSDGVAKSIAVYLNGDAIGAVDTRGEPVTDDTFLLLLNAAAGPVDFTLPPSTWAGSWVLSLDTASGQHDEGDRTWKAGKELVVDARSLMLLRRAD